MASERSPLSAFKSIGPAVIVAAVVLGPGSIIVSSKVGAVFGYSALWILALALILLVAMVRLAAHVGLAYDVWDTENTDSNEPGAADLVPYEMVVWFTGHEFGGFAGPSTTTETALATWLDAGGCFFISAQDYFYDKGLTTFMQNHLGVTSVVKAE